MGTELTRIHVPFRGEGSGVDELTWAQQDVWDITRRTGRTLNIGGTVPLSPDETVDGIVKLLQFILERHQSLRTRLQLVEGGRPRQVVSTDGEIPLDILDVDPADDLDAVVEDQRGRYQMTGFDLVNEWPVRMCIARRDGVLTHLVVMYAHLAIDGFGLQELVNDLAHLDRETGRGTQPPAGTPPLEQARQQRSPSGRRASQRSLDQWAKVLRSIPAQRYAGAAKPAAGDLPIWELRGTSPAMALAIRSISARTGFDSHPVLLAACATALTRITGVTPAVVQILVSNRFRPGFGPSVSNVRQFGLCALDPTGCGFDELVDRAWKSLTNAYLHGYYDTIAHQELLAAINRERGEDVDISCYFNDRRVQAAEPDAGPPPTGAEVAAALPLTHIRWGYPEATYDGSFYLHIEDAADVVEFALFADTRIVSPEDMQLCARTFEATVVEAALDEARVG